MGKEIARLLRQDNKRFWSDCCERLKKGGVFVYEKILEEDLRNLVFFKER
jgi:hypothetical protein